jgi:hypothetical protein
MAAAIWSCPTGSMLDYPLATFVRFCHNHGLLQIFDRPLWRTVQGGGREYVNKLAASIEDIRLATPVQRVFRDGAGCCWPTTRDGEEFDQVVLACHSDQALAILGEDGQRRPSGACWAPSATSPTTPCCTPTPRCCRASAACGRPGTTCRQRRAERAAGVGVLPDQPPAAAAVQAAGGGDAQPAARTRRRRRPSPPSTYDASDLRRPGHRRPAGTACPPGDATASGSAAPGAATVSTRTACAPAWPWPAPSAAARPGTANWTKQA